MGYQDLIEKIENYIVDIKTKNKLIELPNITGINFIETINLLKWVSQNVYLCYNPKNLIVGIYDRALEKFIPCHYQNYKIVNGVLVLELVKGDSTPLSRKQPSKEDKKYYALYDMKTGEYITGNYYSLKTTTFKMTNKAHTSSVIDNGYHEVEGVIILGCDEDSKRLIYDTNKSQKYDNFKFFGKKDDLIYLYDANYKVGEKIVAVFDFKTREVYEAFSAFQFGMPKIFQDIYYYLEKGKKKYFHKKYKTKTLRWDSYNVIYFYNNANEINITLIFDDEGKIIRKFLGCFREVKKEEIGEGFPEYSRYFLYDNELYILNPFLKNSSTYPFEKIANLKGTLKTKKENLPSKDNLQALKIFCDPLLNQYGIEEKEQGKEIIPAIYQEEELEGLAYAIKLTDELYLLLDENANKILGLYDNNTKIIKRFSADDYEESEGLIFFKNKRQSIEDGYELSIYDLEQKKFFLKVATLTSAFKIFKNANLTFLVSNDGCFFYDATSSCFYGAYSRYEIRDNYVYLYSRYKLEVVYDREKQKLNKCYSLPIKSHYSYKLEELYFLKEKGNLKLLQPNTNFKYMFKKIGSYQALVLSDGDSVFATIIFNDELTFAKAYLGEILEFSRETTLGLGVPLQLEKVYYMPKFQKLCYLPHYTYPLKKDEDSMSSYLEPFVEIPTSYVVPFSSKWGESYEEVNTLIEAEYLKEFFKEHEDEIAIIQEEVFQKSKVLEEKYPHLKK